MSEIKPCPFCGAVPKPDFDGAWEHPRQVVMCPTEDCTMSAVMMELGDWQRRSVEDALTARIAELEAELADMRIASNAAIRARQNTINELEAAFTYPDGMRHDGPPQP